MQPHIDRIGVGKSQITRVEHIRGSVAALDGKLEMLVACMPPEAALLALSSDNRDPANPSFARPFPFQGALFLRDVRDEIMSRAKKHDRLCISASGGNWNNRHPDIDSLREGYARDVNCLHAAYFGGVSTGEQGFTLCQAGLFTKPRSVVHCDGDPQDVQYVSRVGALTLEIISHQILQDSGEDVWALIDQGEKRCGFEARQTLRGMDILVPAALNAVHVLLGGDQGTEHCSSEEIPPEGLHSGFFFALRSFTLGAPRL